MHQHLWLYTLTLCTVLLCAGIITRADDFSSTDFKVLGPVLAPGGYSSSNSYTLSGTVGEGAHNKGSSASYGVTPGFFSFPFVTKAQLSAQTGNASGAVDLSWTASVPYLGYSISGYKVGKSSTSGGPYTFAAVGNVLTYRASALTNGTPYYFVVNTLDQTSIVIATSTEISATPISPTLTFVVDSGTENFPSLTPGSLAATSSVLTALTTNNSGFTVTLVRANTNDTLSLSTDATVTISDKTDWTAPGATTTGGPTTASSTQATTLQFRLWKAQTDTANYATSWWGTDDTNSGALFAGIPSTTQTIVNRSVSAPSTTTMRVLYDLNVPITQKSGSYTGSVSYSITTNP